MESSFVGRAVTKQGQYDLVGLTHLDAQPNAHGDGQVACHNTLRAQVVGFYVGNVHGAAASAAVSGFFSHEFSHHAVQIAAPHEEVAMTAVRI